MSDQRYEFLIGMHEVMEAYLAIYAGVSPDAVDRFDKAYEAKRKPGDDSEPGDDPRAPYHREHVFASKVERLSRKSLASTRQFTTARCPASDCRPDFRQSGMPGA
ncbi:MAG TPA: hypothetical protein VJ251_05615 [Stellaceae bacterium]|nr:hypothetical protein [Stellaceae bacterium]